MAWPIALDFLTDAPLVESLDSFGALRKTFFLQLRHFLSCPKFVIRFCFGPNKLRISGNFRGGYTSPVSHQEASLLGANTYH
jgi:hypothetical protein